MYSDLCIMLVRLEAKRLADIEESKSKEQRFEEAKKEFDEKLQRAKEDLKEGVIDRIPKDLENFDFKEKKGNKLITFCKTKTVLRAILYENVRVHVEKLCAEYEVDKSDPDWEEKIAKHKDKVIGNVRFIGSLYNKDFISMTLLFRIFDDYLISHPLKALESNCALTRTHLELIEACCKVRGFIV